MAELLELPVAFSRSLRDAGIGVTIADSLDYARALEAVGLSRRSHLYWAGRATFVRDPDDVAVYDTVFADFFDGRIASHTSVPAPSEVVVAHDAATDPEPDDAAGPPDDEPTSTPVVAVRWSHAEVLRERDFASLSAEEFDEASRLMNAIRFIGATRHSRRHRPSRRHNRLDVRATMRTALRHGGEPIRRAYRAPTRRPRRVVFLCDISGSMERYTRALLRFVQATVVARRSVEVFTLGTRLTRITAAVNSRDPDAALAAVATRVPDLGGGTRLGVVLKAFNDQWGVRGTARGAVVVILSDGWDRGEPELLGTEMARLRRVAHRIVWVNPLKAGEGYAPLAGGMAAALPFVDSFMEGHSLSALHELARVIDGTD